MKNNRRDSIGIYAAVLVCLAIIASVPLTFAASTTPGKFVYNGHLLDSSSNAITSEMSIRFSYWSSADFVAGDTTASGSINTSASNYASWNEVHTVTPDSNGFFSVELGSVTTLPDFSTMATATLTSLHLQVEVKTSAGADTTYELLDSDGSSDSIDRSPLLSVPFARNADLLDQREVGTQSGKIAVLQEGDVFDKIHIPAGTIKDIFTLDSDDSAAGDITLQFGETLAKTLQYDQANTYFEFNDDVNIQGNLTTTGLINGVDVTALGSSTDQHLKVSSGAGLTISVAAGTYRLNGTFTDFAGIGSVAVTASTTNYVFIGSGGVAVYTSGFPTDESIIRLAEVVTSGSGVTSVTDRRAFSSDDRERANEMTFHAEFSNTVFVADGANNVGQLHIESDASARKNYYYWTSTQTDLNDYDIKMRVTLPDNFLRWKADPIEVSYRSTTANGSDNALTVSVLDTAGNAVSVSGSASNLASTTWATSTISYLGTPTWTAGEDVTFTFHMEAKDNNQIHLSSLKLQYIELTGN